VNWCKCLEGERLVLGKSECEIGKSQLLTGCGQVGGGFKSRDSRFMPLGAFASISNSIPQPSCATTHSALLYTDCRFWNIPLEQLLQLHKRYNSRLAYSATPARIDVKEKTWQADSRNTDICRAAARTVKPCSETSSHPSSRTRRYPRHGPRHRKPSVWPRS
jgi:hypothetical protein